MVRVIITDEKAEAVIQKVVKEVGEDKAVVIKDGSDILCQYIEKDASGKTFIAGKLDRRSNLSRMYEWMAMQHRKRGCDVVFVGQMRYLPFRIENLADVTELWRSPYTSRVGR